MPDRTEVDRKEDRNWYRQPFDYRKRWRDRQWGPLALRHFEHPLRSIFRTGGMSHDAGVRWLKAKLFIGGWVTVVEDIHISDVHWILDMAEERRFSMEYVEDLRERWQKNLKKVA